MQINGSSNLSDYYALLTQQRAQQVQKSSPGAEALAGTEEESDFSSIFSQLGGGESAQGTAGATRPPPPPQQAGGGEESGSGVSGTSAYSSIPGDTDGDGELSAEELAALLEEQEAEDSEMPRGGPPPRGGSGSSFVSEWSTSLNYADFMGGGASADGSTSESLGLMRDKIRAAYGA